MTSHIFSDLQDGHSVTRSGHSCAVAAAVAGAKEPGHIAAVLEAIEPAVEKTKGKSGDPVENAVPAQALDVAKQLEEAKPILAERVQSGKLKIVAACYDLVTG